MTFFRRTFYAALVLVMLSAPQTHAAPATYDRYATLAPEQLKSPCPIAKAATEFLTYPFELLRWPADRGAILFDKYQLWDKGQWLYETGVDHGFTPRIDGADFDLIRMANSRTRLPDATLKSWVSYSSDYFIAGGRTGWERIAGTPLRAFVWTNYENRPHENFYGLGPHTSRADGTSYQMEDTTVQGEFGYSANPSLGADLFAAYKRVNITNGHTGGMGVIDNVFGNQTIPGLSGDEIFSTGIKMAYDTRDLKDNSTKGQLSRFLVSYNEGLYSSNARYFHYEVEHERFISLGSKRRVLVARFYGEHNNEAEGHSVPFHQMMRLGGYGINMGSGTSQTLRGYDTNRFYGESGALVNLEYRYTVYEYRDWKIDSVLFAEEGQVFNDFSRFKFSDFRDSYGGGFRIGLSNIVLLSLEVGHGDEGTHFYVKSRSPF